MAANLFSQACLGIGITIVFLSLLLAILAFIVDNSAWFGSIGILLCLFGILLVTAGVVISRD